MLKVLIGAAAAGAVAISPSLANDLEDYCVAYTTENDGDPSGCSCLADEADDAMADELMNVQSQADIDALSDASKAAIAECWPEAESAASG